jgi:uncharacterized protein
MLARDGYIPGVPCWVDTWQPDPAAAADFYGQLFGWQLEDVMPEGSASSYYIGRLHGGDVAAIGSVPQDAPAPTAWNTYIWVHNADETAAGVQGAGGRVLSPPCDIQDAGRSAVCADPDGAVFFLWQARGHKGARIVNEPGSLNFNVLNVRDRGRAESFYGSVFGWRTLDVEGGMRAWRLPGYGYHLEQLDPGIRERMAQLGAPAGFEDVVAALSQIDDDRPDVPAHWGVTFAVDDADAVAAKADELGGQVLVAPFDAPWVRMTVISDPQGATFTASRFVPENSDLGEHAGSTTRAA